MPRRATPDIRSLLFDRDPYLDFPLDRYPLDLAGWGSTDPNFRELVTCIAPRLIIEVGSWKGGSAIHSATVAQDLGLAIQILCVDTWLGGLEFWMNKADKTQYGALSLRFGYPTVYYQFLANVLHCGFGDVITPFPQSSSIAARWLHLHHISADLVYLDGSHDEEDVYADMRHYWGLVLPGGAMFGDDYHSWESVRRAVHRFSEEHSVDFEIRGRHWVVFKSAEA